MPIYSTDYLASRLFYYVGQLIAYSFAHGQIGFVGMSPAICSFLVHGSIDGSCGLMAINDIADYQLREIIERLSNGNLMLLSICFSRFFHLSQECSNFLVNSYPTPRTSQDIWSLPLKFLSRYLPRHTLDQLYKLHVRPHLDYGDVIFHTPAKLCEFSHNEILTSSMEKLESVQYSAALAVTGTWRGTSRANLYAELGWESLNLRRWSRRLKLLYKIVNNLTPSYMTEPIPLLQQSHYTLRNPDVIGRIRARTEKFKCSFYPSCLTEWNELDPEIRLAPSVTVFKKTFVDYPPPCKICFWDS